MRRLIRTRRPSSISRAAVCERAMQAANAEREGDAAKAAARQWRSWRRLQDAVEMLDAQADQDATTANTSGFGNRR